MGTATGRETNGGSFFSSFASRSRTCRSGVRCQTFFHLHCFVLTFRRRDPVTVRARRCLPDTYIYVVDRQREAITKWTDLWRPAPMLNSLRIIPIRACGRGRRMRKEKQIFHAFLASMHHTPHHRQIDPLFLGLPPGGSVCSSASMRCTLFGTCAPLSRASVYETMALLENSTPDATQIKKVKPSDGI